jgi:hypothetical protein
MTLRGSLSDLNVVELVQVPAAGRKSGELIIASLEADARLYYREGKLVHLATGDTVGQEVLVEILGWTEGEFEFRQSIVTNESSFDGDLHRAIMMSLKERDERSRAGDPSADRDEVGDEQLAIVLGEHLGNHEYLIHASVISLGGRVIACANAGNSDPEGVDELRRSICALAKAYPRQALQRVLLEDELGTVASSCLEADLAVMIVADRSTRVGAVSMCLERLVRTLSERGAPRE